MQWKFETPLGGLHKLLANDMGYNALVSAAKAKKRDIAVFVFMPPPVKVEEVWLAFDTIIVGSNDGFVRHGSLAKRVTLQTLTNVWWQNIENIIGCSETKFDQ